VRVANGTAPSAQWTATLDALLGLDAEDVLRYDDKRLEHSRRIRIAGDRLLAVRLTGGAAALTSGEWLRDWLVSSRPVAEVRRLLLSPATHAPAGFVLAGRVVCQCWNVSEPEILAALAATPGAPGERLAQLRAQLKCGTNCGSCLPELRALVEKAAGNARRMVA
jgi:assimilatory nitrate reductase catalytic subunit